MSYVYRVFERGHTHEAPVIQVYGNKEFQVWEMNNGAVITTRVDGGKYPDINNPRGVVEKLKPKMKIKEYLHKELNNYIDSTSGSRVVLDRIIKTLDLDGEYEVEVDDI